ncbi:MAG: hypothetical protein KDD48_04915 [Bdellovibrionales bacterium]|nr:hypothetical protein [Bdellovibrionales bacterium]
MQLNLNQNRVIDKLLKDHFEFKKLYQEHELMKKKLRKMEGMRYLSLKQENERKRIQKMKLWGKDRMYEIIRKASEKHYNA